MEIPVAVVAVRLNRNSAGTRLSATSISRIDWSRIYQRVQGLNSRRRNKKRPLGQEPFDGDVVETRGLEPLTSAMRTLRSPS